MEIFVRSSTYNLEILRDNVRSSFKWGGICPESADAKLGLSVRAGGAGKRFLVGACFALGLGAQLLQLKFVKQVVLFDELCYDVDLIEDYLDQVNVGES